MQELAVNNQAHFIKDQSPDKYAKLEQYVREYHEREGRSVAQLEREQTELAKQNGITLPDGVAMEEVVATTLEGMLSDGSIIEHVANIRKIDGTLGDKIKARLSEMIQKIKDAYAGIPAQTKNSRFLSEAEDAVSELQELFEDALLDASDNYTRGEKKKASGEETEDEKYDLDESLGIQLYDWLDGQGKKYGSYNGKFFNLGTTPTILTKHGAPSVELIMYDDVITKVTGGKHSISLDEIAKLPSQLNDPILLFSGTVPNSFVALTELVDKQGNDVIVAVHINKHYSRNVVNKIASLYSKSDSNGNNHIIDYVQRQIDGGNLIDASNNKASNWFTTRGLQLPKVVQTILDASKRISQKDPVVNSNDMQSGEKNTADSEKTSKSQTSANLRADEVYKKKTELAVGDKVGDVTLMADSDTGEAVTPKLRASFDREDMSSYILATIESIGDTELVGALEEEMTLMMMQSDAELPMHDAVDILSEYVSDGSITPEQAAQILSKELSDPTGADIPTLVERALNDGVRWSLEDYNKPITVDDVDVLKSIDKINGKPKSISQFTSEDIEKAQKWAYKFYKDIGTKSPFFRAWFGDWRSEEDAPVTIANIPEYVATNEARKQQRGIVKNKDTATNKEKTNGWEIRISREGETNTISHAGNDRKSEYGLAGIRSLIENAILLDSEVHEHHSNNAKVDLISFDHKLYAIGTSNDGTVGLYKITVEEFYQSKTEPSNKRFHNLRYIEKIADIPGGRTFDNNRSGGSTNGTSTIKYSISDLFELVKEYDKDFHYQPVDSVLLNSDGTPKVFYHGTSEDFTAFSTDEIASREGSFFFAENRMDAEAYGENVFEVYLQGRKLADYDNQPREFYRLKDKRAQVEYLKDKGYDGWYADMDSDGWGELSVFSPGQIKSAVNNIGTFDSNNLDIRYSLAETDTVSAVDYEKQVQARIKLAEGLQSIAQSSTEYEALERYKQNASKIVEEYARLDALNRELRELNKAPDKDTDRIKALKADIRKLNNDIDIYESGMRNIASAAPFREMLARATRRQTEEINRARHEYYERQKARTQSRHNAETRNKIKRVIVDLNTLLNHPTKEKNVKIEMQDAIGSALSLGNAMFGKLSNAEIAQDPRGELTGAEEQALPRYRALTSEAEALQAKLDEARANGTDTASLCR